MSTRRIKNRIRTRKNKKLGQVLRAEVKTKGLTFKNTYGNSDITGNKALYNIAFPKDGCY